jgi:DNA-binding transcriptional LysR family regulator
MASLASIDLNLLVALDALIAEAHVGRAARKIGLSQPAASHALRRLRDLLNDPLLVRTGVRMQLTPRARSLREPLAEALHRVQGVLAAESFEPARSTRRFSVMMQDHVAHLVLPPLVKRMNREAPGVKLDVLPWQSPLAESPDREGPIDLKISCVTKELAEFQREMFFTDTEVTVVRRGNPAAARMKQLKEFLKARHVAVVGRGLPEDPVDTWLREEKLERTIALRVPGYVQALQAVAQTDLVAFVPKRLAEAMTAALKLVIVRPPLEPGEYQEYLLYPRRAVSDPGSIWLRRIAREIGAQIEGKSLAA